MILIFEAIMGNVEMINGVITTEYFRVLTLLSDPLALPEAAVQNSLLESITTTKLCFEEETNVNCKSCQCQ